MDFPRCYACMEALPDPQGACPRCGRKNEVTAREQDNHALPCGASLHGRYVIGKVLGQGGFGISYIGWDLAMQTSVCIKEYFPAGAAMRNTSIGCAVSWSGGENARALKGGRDSFVREAQKAVKLRDIPTVVSVWDVFYENDTAYIIMDYIRGETIKDSLEREKRPLTPEECLKLLLPMLRDLDKVHARGIVHRDISPDNIMLRPDGSPVLLDLGAAKDLSLGAPGTRSSHLVIKKGFSPVEQYIEGGSIGAWTDVYAMCATIVWCVTGRVPPESFARSLGDPRVDLSAFPSAAAQVLEKGLAVRPEQRIRSMGELADGLEAALGLRKSVEAMPADPREAIYASGKSLMRKDDAVSLQTAAGAFASLGGYRDAAKLAESCRKRLNELARIEQEQQEAERKRIQLERTRAKAREEEQRRAEAQRKQEERRRREDEQRRAEETKRQAAKAVTASYESPKSKKPKRLIPVIAAALVLVIGLVAFLPKQRGTTPAVTAPPTATAAPTPVPKAEPSATPEPTPTPDPLSMAQVGDYVTFGAYEQDNDLTNGKEDIEWLVLAREEDRILVISRYGLDCQQYHHTGQDSMTWEECDLRAWLNETFLNEAFSGEQQEHIPNVTVKADADPDPSNGMNPGNDTSDQVFLLSMVEAKRYFADDTARQCAPTAYAVAQGSSVNPNNGFCWWWLRSPGYYSYYAAYVYRDGSVGYIGYGVDYIAVRPALWINL